MSKQFVHLGVHTEYSLVDSVVRVPELMKAVAKEGMPAVALTDAANVFALVKFYRAAQAAGIKPIIGVDVRLGADSTEEETGAEVTLLARNWQGYLNLSALITQSYTCGQRFGVPYVSPEWLKDQSAGLLLLAGLDSPAGKAVVAGRPEAGKAWICEWASRFPDAFYMLVSRVGLPEEERFNAASVAWAEELHLPIVAGNRVRFLSPEDFDAHEARVAIHQGYRLNDPNRPRRYTREQYLKSPAAMAELFGDLPEALENTIQIARRCNLRLELGRSVLPAFPLPEGVNEATHLQQRAEQGLLTRLSSDAFEPAQPEQHYRRRLTAELDVITRMGFCGYFLIVADFIQWARKQGIPVGPGRGSGAGSLVAYALGITDLDPLAYDLLFERFLNPERVSMPDFDIDFCMEGRDRVIDYVAQRYGRDRVSQIITYGSMAARAVVRDVGRVLGHPYGYVDRIAKLVPFELGMTLGRALEQSDELRTRYREDEDVRVLIDLAQKLEGLPRNAGKHAGGVVIAPAPLTEFTPLYAEANGASAVTQLDKDDVEKVGLVKFDFLGLRTLTIINHALERVNRLRQERGDPPLSMEQLPRDDEKTFELLKSCETTAVFQLESRGMKELIGRLKPDTFEDIIALVALFRPGPLQSGMVDDFINRKRGDAQVVYPHPDLESILKPTYGVILYQEQVMQIAQVLAGYSLGGADLLRRAMGKKKPEEMARQRDIFMAGASKRGVERKVAKYIFDLMEKFAGYGFNKSHSAAYALLTYQTAWLKAHYPAAYMAAVLSADMDHTDKIVRLIDECRRMGLTIAAPDINRSGFAFEVADENCIRYGLGAIKGLGRGAVDALVENRHVSGPYEDLVDLCRRVDTGRVNRRALEALIEAGALDGLGPSRAWLARNLPQALQLAEQAQQARLAGQDDMFGLQAAPKLSSAADLVDADTEEWEEREKLSREKRALGLYFSGHPISRHRSLLDALGIAPLAKLNLDSTEKSGSRPVVAAGLIMELRRIRRRLVVTLDDQTARVEAVLFDEAAERLRHALSVDQVVVIEGRLSYDDFTGRYRITVQNAQTIDVLARQQARYLWIDWKPNGYPWQHFVEPLKEALSEFQDGKCGVGIRYYGSGGGVCLKLGNTWHVSAEETLTHKLERLPGVEGVQIIYERRPG